MKLLFKKNYLTMIENSAKGENRMFRNFYIVQDNIEKDAYEDGRWSCSVFVSSILYLQNSMLEFLKKEHWIKFTHANVESTTKDMIANGWYEIRELNPGAVIVWENKLGNDDNAMHFHNGFCINETEAISNDSKGSGLPHRHHIIYNGTRKIEKIYWHPELND
ncbi:MAG TPA: hypothetical protein VJC06_03120 [Candidatus Paceibacterota bacterium]